MKFHFFILVCVFLRKFGVINGNSLDNGPSPRIVGGTVAYKGQFPYLVSLRIERVRFHHFCGGSILNKKWILTAAHCIHGKQQGSIVVAVGSNSLYQGVQYYRTSQHIMYPGFSYDVFQDDVGLIKVSSTIKFNKFVKPIELPKYDMNLRNRRAIVAGWGALEYRGKMPIYLRYIKTSVIDLEDCSRYYGGETFLPSDLCTINSVGEGFCHGDSGSPLVVDDVQIGIVSRTAGCAFGYPDIYARVWSYKDWIEGIIKSDCDNLGSRARRKMQEICM